MISLKDKNVLLVNAFDDDIEQEGNGKYQLSFKYPTSDQRWKNIELADLLLADDLHGEQEFRVFEIVKRNGYIFVYANQVVDDLNSYSISSISVDRVNGQTAMQALAGSIIRKHPFAFYSDIQDRHIFNQKNISVMDALANGKHSIVGQWGGDLVRDKYNVNLLKRGGRESEALFMYKKNLKSYTETNSIKGLFTRLNLSVKDSDIKTTVDSPLIDSYGGRIYELNIEVTDQDVTTLERLQEYGRNYFAEKLIDVPNNSLTISVTDNQEYDVRIFDMVFVHHEIFDKDLRMKITSYRFSPMGRKLKSIGFGKIKANLNQQVSNIATEVVEQSVSVAGQVFEEKLQKEIENADKVIDGKINKVRDEIKDGLERSRAEAERHADNIKRSIDTEITQVNTSMQAQSQEHDRQVADILSKTQSVESLANQAKSDAASAIARANQVKTEAIADARAQVATVSQALNTAKSELQTAIANADQKARDSQASATALRNDLNLQASKILEQARAQTALTNRVLTVETLADGTRSTVAELSKTVSKATGDIASVTSRTKSVEDTLSQTRTQYEALTQTVNTQTGQIESINRKTADLQSGIDGVREKFENLQVGGENLLLNAGFEGTTNSGASFTVGGVTYIAKRVPNWHDLYNGGIPNPTTSYHAIYRESFEGKGPVIEFNESDGSRNWKAISAILDTKSLTVGGNYTFSADIYATGTGTKIWFGFYYYNKNGVRNFHSGQTTINIGTINKWHRVAGQIKLNEDIDLSRGTNFYIYAYNFTTNSILYLTKPKLENGTVPTAFSLAQETIRSEIATYKRTAEESSAELSRQIQLADGKAVEAKTYAQQTAEGFKNRLESLETYKDGESTRAQAYFEASKTETAKQINAERTAIANSYVAKSTYQEDARGTTLKLNEIKTIADTAKQNLATYQNTVDRKLEELTSSTQTLDGKINTASAKVDTVAGQIRTEISSVEGKIPSTIGGQNLLLNSGFEGATPYPGEYFAVGGVQYISKRIPNWRPLYNSGIKNPTTSYHAIYKEEFEGKGPVIEFNESDGSRNWKAINSILQASDLSFGNYTFSADIYATGTGTNIQFGFYYYNKNGVQTFHTGYLTVNITTINKWHRVAGQIKLGDDVNLSRDVIFFIYSYNFKTNSIVYLTKPKLETGNIPTDYTMAQRDISNEISAVKTTINQTSQGVEQLTTSLSTTNDKVSTAETKIRQLISDVSSKVSQTDYNTLTGRVSSAETAITQNATEISKRLTSTQVDKAITDKGYQTKSDVDNNITGRGYITSSALQPYALSTTVQNLVQETAGSFERQITETRGLIPTEVNQNLFDVVFSDLRATGGASFVQSDDGWIEVTIKNRWSGFHWLYSDNIKPSEKQYVLSYEAYLVDTVANTAYLETDFGSPDQSLRINKTPKRYTVVLNRPANIYNYINFVCNSSETGKKFRIRNIKLEEGIVATPYIAPFPTTVLFNAVKDTVDAHKRLIGNGDSISQAIQSANKFERSISSGGDIYQAIETAKGLVTEVSGTNGLKTQVSQLAGSYAIQNLTNSGTVLNQLNLNRDGSVKIDGKLVQITGTTYIQDGVITSAKIAGLDAGKINTGELNAARIKANSIDGSKLKFDQAFFNGLTANEAYLQQLFAKSAFITQVQAVTLSASKISGGILTATNRAMEVNLNAGQILYYTDQAALKRVLNGYPTQFVKFATGTVTGKGNAGVTVIGSNRWNSESSNDGGFVGIRAWNGANIDQIDVVGDTVRLASSAFEAADGWNINTLPGKLDIDAFNAEHRASSKIKVGDLWLWKNATTYSSMRDTINLIIDNLQLLHNNKSTERGYSYTLPAKV